MEGGGVWRGDPVFWGLREGESEEEEPWEGVLLAVELYLVVLKIEKHHVFSRVCLLLCFTAARLKEPAISETVPTEIVSFFLPKCPLNWH